MSCEIPNMKSIIDTYRFKLRKFHYDLPQLHNMPEFIDMFKEKLEAQITAALIILCEKSFEAFDGRTAQITEYFTITHDHRFITITDLCVEIDMMKQAMNMPGDVTYYHQMLDNETIRYSIEFCIKELIRKIYMKNNLSVIRAFTGEVMKVDNSDILQHVFVVSITL